MRKAKDLVEFTILYKLSNDPDQDTYRTVVGKFASESNARANLKSLVKKGDFSNEITECVLFRTRTKRRGRPKKIKASK